MFVVASLRSQPKMTLRGNPLLRVALFQRLSFVPSHFDTFNRATHTLPMNANPLHHAPTTQLLPPRGSPKVICHFHSDIIQCSRLTTVQLDCVRDLTSLVSASFVPDDVGLSTLLPHPTHPHARRVLWHQIFLLSDSNPLRRANCTLTSNRGILMEVGIMPKAPFPGFYISR